MVSKRGRTYICKVPACNWVSENFKVEKVCEGFKASVQPQTTEIMGEVIT